MKGIVLTVIGIVILIAFSCSNEGGGFFARLLKGGGSAVPVTVESVVVQERAQEMKIPANLEAPEAAEVTLTEDVAVERVAVAEGDAVGAGDPLVKISEQEIAARLARRRADLKEAQATLEKNTYFLKNRDRLIEERRLDLTQYENLESEVAANEAAVEKLGQEVARIEERAISTTVTSPIAGVVTKVNISAGMMMPAGKPMMSITKPDPMIATLRLPSHRATAVRPGMTVRIRFPDLGGEAAMARITSVGAELDPEDNTFEVKAAIPNPLARYKAGMKAEAEFTTPERQRFFLIPEEALIKERQAFFVFTVSKGTAHKVQVIPSETQGDRVEIVRGLEEADIVVVKGHDKLTEGNVVDIWRR